MLEKKKELLISSYFDHLLSKQIKKLLIIIPDQSRYASKAREIILFIYKRYSSEYQFHFLIATGTHKAMEDKELETYYSPIPVELFSHHDYLKDTGQRMQITSEEISLFFQKKFNFSVEVTFNKKLYDDQYDRILSIGQVVPHEVLGMSNYTKNIVIGLGGRDIIDKTHYISALLGIENILGEGNNLLRKWINKILVEANIQTPIDYFLTVVDSHDQSLRSLHIGSDEKVFEEACRESSRYNIFYEKQRYKKVLGIMGEDFKSTWLINKAIYRLRLIIEEEGELHIYAPFLSQFGESDKIDELIYKYGYVETTKDALDLVDHQIEIKSYLALVAHLIHSCSEKKFKVIYYTQNQDFIDHSFKANITVKSIEELPSKETFDFTCDNPALGLWKYKKGS